MAHSSISCALNSTELVSTATGALPKTTSTSVCKINYPSVHRGAPLDKGLSNNVPDTDDQIDIVQKHVQPNIKRTPQYQFDSELRSYQSVLRKLIDNANDNLADCDDVPSLNSSRTRIVSAFDELQLASFKLANVSEEHESIIRIENEPASYGILSMKESNH